MARRRAFRRSRFQLGVGTEQGERDGEAGSSIVFVRLFPLRRFGDFGCLFSFGRRRTRIFGVLLSMGDQHFRRSGGHDEPSAGTCFRAHVNQPIALLDDVHVVFDHNDRVPKIHQSVEHFQQLRNIFEVQPGGRFVQQIQGTTGVGARKFRRQFHALGFPSGECRRGLAERQVIKPDVAQRSAMCGESWGCF